MKIVKRALALGLGIAMLASSLTVGAADATSVTRSKETQNLTESSVASAAAKGTSKGTSGNLVQDKNGNVTVDFEIKDSAGNVLTKDKDYIIITDDNTDQGTHTARIVGIGSYSIDTKKTYTIERPAPADRVATPLQVLATSTSTTASKITQVKLTTVSDSRGAVTYSVKGAAKKYLKVENGKLVFKNKKAKKAFKQAVKTGKIKTVKVKAKRKGFNQYLAASATRKINVTA